MTGIQQDTQQQFMLFMLFFIEFRYVGSLKVLLETKIYSMDVRNNRYQLLFFD